MILCRRDSFNIGDHLWTNPKTEPPLFRLNPAAGADSPRYSRMDPGNRVDGMAPSKWDNRFLDLAELVASWSKDDSTHVGACIVDASNRVVSLGYNGPPQGVKDGFVDRDQKLRRTLHAETNAILFANKDIAGCTLYVTHPPCAHCAAMIIQRGIARVVFIAPAPGFTARWAEDVREAKNLFEEAGVKVTGYASTSAYSAKSDRQNQATPHQNKPPNTLP